MGCLDKIVTLGLCDTDVSTSGFTLMAAAGMSVSNLANIAPAQYVQGVKLAETKKALALLMLRNDFMGVLQGNNIATSIADPIYTTSSFMTGVDMGLYSGARGVTIHANNNNYRGTLRRRIITGIQCYPLTSGTADIQIVDVVNGVTIITPYPATFIANSVNTFALNYVCNNATVRVLIDNTEINFSSSAIVCLKGCSETMPNPCGWADGWDGISAVKSEGYGISVQFKCACDYERILCDLAQSYVGELIWLKWQELIYEEHYKTSRFTSWVIYNRDDIQSTILPDLKNQYAAKWNDMVSGALLNILNTYRDDCLNCRGIRMVTNI